MKKLSIMLVLLALFSVSFISIANASEIEAVKTSGVLETVEMSNSSLIYRMISVIAMIVSIICFVRGKFGFAVGVAFVAFAAAVAGDVGVAVGIALGIAFAVSVAVAFVAPPVAVAFAVGIVATFFVVGVAIAESENKTLYIVLIAILSISMAILLVAVYW